MELDSIEELNKLEEQIKSTQKLLENNNDDKVKIKKLKQRNIILGILTILFLASSIWFYFLKSKNSNNFKNGNKYMLVEKDSIRFYKDFYQNFEINDVKDGIINKLTIANEKIIYSVQLGAFRNFKLTSDNLMNLKEFTENGYTKFSIGNFTTYDEALTLKYNLKKLGFSDCFVIAQSYGKQIDIYDALSLSNETKYLQ